LEYGVETTNDEVLITVTNPSTGMERADADITLDAFDVLPTRGSGYAGVLERLADGGVHVGEAGEDRW
jgi:hypothetical protein